MRQRSNDSRSTRSLISARARPNSAARSDTSCPPSTFLCASLGAPASRRPCGSRLRGPSPAGSRVACRAAAATRPRPSLPARFRPRLTGADFAGLLAARRRPEARRTRGAAATAAWRSWRRRPEGDNALGQASRVGPRRDPNLDRLSPRSACQALSPPPVESRPCFARILGPHSSARRWVWSNHTGTPVPVLSRSRPALCPGPIILIFLSFLRKRDSGTGFLLVCLVRARTCRDVPLFAVPLSRFSPFPCRYRYLAPGRRAGRDRDRTGTGRRGSFLGLTFLAADGRALFGGRAQQHPRRQQQGPELRR